MSSGSITLKPSGVAPVLLDLNGDGVFSTQQLVMDVNSDGQLDQTTWAGKADGVLVWDQGGDGKVTHMREYAFTLFGGNTDLEGLRLGFDSNGDGVLDARDAKFGEFAVWQDANGNGTSDAGEVRTLADLGIMSVNLTSNGQSDASQPGMLVHGTTTAQTAQGEMQVADAIFSFHTLPVLDLNAVLQDGVADMANGQTQVLKLTASDLLQLPAKDSGVQQLKVLGDSSDIVSLDKLTANGQDGTWSQNGTVTQDGQQFNVYQNSADPHLQVLIDQHIVQGNVQLG